MPERTPTGMLRNTKQMTRISPVPVSSMGGTLNAKIYDTPTTVPGIAKLIIVANSKARRPAKSRRDSRYAVNSPKMVVSGAAIAETSIVVDRESQADPVKSSPPAPGSIENAVA